MNDNEKKQRDEDPLFVKEEVKNNKLDINEQEDLNNQANDILENDIEEGQKTSESEKLIDLSLQDELSKLRDEKLRLLADMENLRKRTDKDRLDSIRYASFNLARDILSPDDNLTRALEAIPDEEKSSKTISSLIDGLKMVQKEFSTILEKHGVKKIKALDVKFDHNFHQAMMEVENDDKEEGMVIQEMQSGYTMHDRLLRPSMVAVSKKKTKLNVEDKNKDEKV